MLDYVMDSQCRSEKEIQGVTHLCDGSGSVICCFCLSFVLTSREVFINIKKLFFQKGGGAEGARGGVTNSLCKLLGHFRKLNLAATPLSIGLVPTRRCLSTRIIKICCWDALNVILKHQFVLSLIVFVPQS